jgi:hypothetical protein
VYDFGSVRRIFYRGQPDRLAVRAIRAFLPAWKAYDQPASGAFSGSRIRQVPAAEHTRACCIPFGSDQPPKEDAQPDSRQGGDREKKNDDLHNRCGDTQTTIITLETTCGLPIFVQAFSSRLLHAHIDGEAARFGFDLDSAVSGVESDPRKVKICQAVENAGYYRRSI